MGSAPLSMLHVCVCVYAWMSKYKQHTHTRTRCDIFQHNINIILYFMWRCCTVAARHLVHGVHIIFSIIFIQKNGPATLVRECCCCCGGGGCDISGRVGTRHMFWFVRSFVRGVCMRAFMLYTLREIRNLWCIIFNYARTASALFRHWHL